MVVLVNGLGNIGKTLLGILNEFRELLGIEEIYALKNTDVFPWIEEDLEILREDGAILLSRSHMAEKDIDSALAKVDYIFDCNANGFGNKNKDWYQSLQNLKGCSAQGSEKGFGVPFMTGVNNEAIKAKRFAQVVSCNTHSIASVLSTFCSSILDLISADFVIVRRSEDLGNHQRLVSANVVSRHMDETLGTHHAIDVLDLYKTIGVSINVQSSDITTPSQLMHTVRFSFQCEQALPDIEEAIERNPFVSRTKKFDSNVIFELGRRYSMFGRLYSHAIINSNNLLIDHASNSVKGWAFIPQEGNTILSTLHAFLLQLDHNKHQDIITEIASQLLRKNW